MAKAIKGFTSDSGKFFEHERDAWLDDLDKWLDQSIDNVAIRNKVAIAILADIANGDHLSKIIGNIQRLSPKMAEPLDEAA